MPRPAWLFRHKIGTSLFRAFKVASCAALVATSVQAKEAPLVAIVLFDGPAGAAYVQIIGLKINGKVELYGCNGDAKINKSTYGRLPRVKIKGARSLEENAEGVLVLTTEQGTVCVLPSDLRFEKGSDLAPQDAARQAILQGTVVSTATTQGTELPALKPGVRLVFVAAPDNELAEFLRAQRARSTALWQDFLNRYPSSSHAVEARATMAGLFEESAESHLAEYRKPVAAGLQSWGDLKAAQQEAEKAAAAVQGFPPALALLEQIQGELTTLTESNRAEFLAYQNALAGHVAGHALLMAASRHNDQILDVNPKYDPALALRTSLVGELTNVDVAIQTAEALLASNRFDDAFRALGSYRFFAPEVPRIDAIVAASFVFHFDRGERLSGEREWEQAVAEYRQALDARSGSREAIAALKNAETELVNLNNRTAADQAIEQSKGYAREKRYIEAYSVLADLTGAQRALVTDQLDALKSVYVKAAFQRAQTLQEVHIPIRGRADENAVREAYNLLVRASALGDDQAVKLKRDLLADKISAYYVEQAKRYLEKPMGSGVGLGWLYLSEAQRHRRNLDVVRDQRTRFESTYQLRAKLSIGVVFRDQTSRRESIGFADQLADAIATDLEGLGLPVKVVRQAAGFTDTVPPNFLLIGEINEHRSVRSPTLETLQSRYRAGTREVKNESWLAANREYEASQQDLSMAQRALEAATLSKNKKKIAAAMVIVMSTQKRMEEAHRATDAIDQSRPQEIIQPYNYMKRTVDVTAQIELAFRINDPAGNLIEPTTRVQRDDHKSYVMLENVKAEDSDGIVPQGVAPDELQIMTDLETQARDMLIMSVREKVLRLPASILQEARKRVQLDDADRAAEQYILYLNATPDVPSPEREEAIFFLQDRFNVGLAQAN